MLTAVDTNIILRDILRDDPVQSVLAAGIMQSGDILIVTTVLAEIEWVLRSVYKWSRAQINHALVALTSIENVMTEDETRGRWAIARHEEGADFADMLHVANAHNSDRFITFDQRVERYAGKNAGIPIETIGDT